MAKMVETSLPKREVIRAKVQAKLKEHSICGKAIKTQIPASGQVPRLKTQDSPYARELQDSRLTSQIRLKTQDSRLVSGA